MRHAQIAIHRAEFEQMTTGDVESILEGLHRALHVVPQVKVNLRVDFTRPDDPLFRNDVLLRMTTEG